jgi:diacylglycerol O-acyltransferase 1
MTYSLFLTTILFIFLLKYMYKVSNVRLLMSSVSSHGFVLYAIIHLIRDLPHIQQDPWEEFPFVSGFALQVVFVLVSFCLEWLLSRKLIPSRLGLAIHHINAHTSLGIPLWIVWNFIDNPAIGAVLLFHAAITWMKLLSYLLANEDYRLNPNDTENMLAIVEDLDPNEVDIRYPDNVTIGNIFYFWFCPSLTYQIAFPKTPRRRWWKIGGIVMRLVICMSLFTFVAAQVVTPVLASLVQDLEASGGSYTASMMADYWLQLAIANTYLWLLLFYGYFHLYLNLFGELLRFGDRVFYRDWWNVADIGAYWRLWNLPVHFWLVRHLYFPSLRHMNKRMATFLVFFLSAIMHELLVSVPFHMIRPWSFIGMMMQIPLVAMTKLAAQKSPTISNMMFWVSFCFVGQPMAALLYTVDFQFKKEQMSRNFLECEAGWNNGTCATE